MKTLTAACLITLLGAFPALAEGPPEIPPDDIGVIATSDAKTICGRINGLTYSRYNRGDGSVEQSLHCPKGWQADHRYPLGAGGANVVANIWCQPGPGMTTFDWKAKDRLDTRAFLEICHRGADPSTVQAWFAADWRASYCLVFNDDPRCAKN